MNRLLTCFLLLTLFSAPFLSAEDKEHPIVYMVSPPRSISTAFMRMIHARGDFEVFHEPSHYAYCTVYYSEFVKENYYREAPSTYAAVLENLLQASCKKPVFAKEMGISSEEFLKANPDFLKNPQVRFVLLIRNPHHSLLSFYKKCPEAIDFMFEVMGYDAILRILETAIASGHPPCRIILAEELLQDPEKEVEAFCKDVNIPFIPGSTHWEPLPPSFDPILEWHEYKFPGPIELYHGDAISSSGFGQPAAYAIDENGSPSFKEVQDPVDREKMKMAYERIVPLYEKIVQYRKKNIE